MEEILRKNHTVRASVTRPADTTAYAAGDVLADSTSAPTVLTFPGVTKGANGGAVISQAMSVSNLADATKPDLELWIFDSAPAATNDNAAFAPSDAEMLNLVGVIPFATASFKVGGGNIVCDVQTANVVVNTKGGVSDLYAVPVVRNIWTAGSAETLTFTLKVED